MITKKTYHSCCLDFFENDIFRKSQHNHRLQIKVKHLVLRQNEEGFTKSEIKKISTKEAYCNNILRKKFWQQQKYYIIITLPH